MAPNTQIDNDDASSSSSEPDIDDGLLQDELSGDTLAALMKFMNTGSCFDESDVDDNERIKGDERLTEEKTSEGSTTNCVIADTLQRLRGDADESTLAHEEKVMANKVLLVLEECTTPEEASSILNNDGVIKINGVLDHNLCDISLKKINQSLLDSDFQSENEKGGEVSSFVGFGKVWSREKRYDMYLPNEGPYKQALACMLCKGSALSDLFHTIFEGKSAFFHELSALISDSGSASQPIHPDTDYTTTAPLYTCFVALQDIDESMGPTLFLPRTHSREVHDRHNEAKTKDTLLADSEYRLGLLKKGDVAIMDSRTLHSGGANISMTPERRRVLLYFTLRNPLYSGEYPPNGSLIPGLSISTAEF
uniref:Phytanoyl-CoA dioxygenase n=1 Tax=Attheya septentrionalis TaxID=420275 RepID=A0A7S2XTW9_9STRA|mmetsp:Transcript_28761/g.52575  ORF Transcript_28761/g.52575 Transcript_28761/m.52575 type:complete len:365 (+) Transcript_28761:67-1161(+)